MNPNIKILVKALQIIQSYDHNGDGICPYGCDTPYIAKKALDDFHNVNCISGKSQADCPEIETYSINSGAYIITYGFILIALYGLIFLLHL